MAVGQQELRLALGQEPLAALEAFGGELHRARSLRPPNRPDPTGEEGQRQGMGGGDAQRVDRLRQPRPHVGARLVDLLQQRFRPGQERRPGSVSVTSRPPRSNREAPAHCSRAWMRRLNAGCVKWRRSAAREKLRLSFRARKSASQVRSILFMIGMGR